MSVDYNFFTFNNLFPAWSKLRLSIILLICCPIIFRFYMTFEKQRAVKKIEERRASVARKAEEERIAEEARIAEAQKAGE